MKDVTDEIKNTLVEMNSRLEDSKENIRDLEDEVQESTETNSKGTVKRNKCNRSLEQHQPS